MEQWTNIEGYTEYSISSLGRVKSHKRIVDHPVNGKYKVKEKILRSNPTNAGYLVVRLSRYSEKVTRTVHRLVAKAFLDNLKNKRCINHKDGDKTNNIVENLEWCTHSENVYHWWNCRKRGTYN